MNTRRLIRYLGLAAALLTVQVGMSAGSRRDHRSLQGWNLLHRRKQKGRLPWASGRKGTVWSSSRHRYVGELLDAIEITSPIGVFFHGCKERCRAHRATAEAHRCLRCCLPPVSAGSTRSVRGIVRACHVFPPLANRRRRRTL